MKAISIKFGGGKNQNRNVVIIWHYPPSFFFPLVCLIYNLLFCHKQNILDYGPHTFPPTLLFQGEHEIDHCTFF